MPDRRHPLGRVAVVAAVCLGACGSGLHYTVPLAVATPSGPCGVDLAAPEIAAAVKSLPPYSGFDYSWTADPPTVRGNFNPCATLSTAIVSVEGATGSSPWAALMFHNGRYLGTATWKSYAFTRLNSKLTTEDTVVLDYKDGRDVCTACPGPVNTVRYQWQGDHVVMLDPAPPDN